MIRIMQALISGIALGLGIGSGLAEMWLTSAACFAGTALGLFLFVRSCLRRAF
jgi:hypothetical protein